MMERYFDQIRLQLLLQYNLSGRMPKQIIVSMKDNYPFGECEESNNEKTRVLVRKVYSFHPQQVKALLKKVQILRKLKNEHMIKIQSVLQEEESIHFLFEYVPIKLQTWISNINDQFIENFRDQLIKFSSFLANNCIIIEFQLKNIGMDQNYQAKYFLDLNFQNDPAINREKLKSNYIRAITNLFKPYLSQPNPNNLDNSDLQKEKSNNQPTQPSSRGNQSKKQEMKSSQSINNNSKNKEKALEQYYQEVNMSVDSQNEKILQEFMDVLHNEEEEHHNQRPVQPIKQQNSPSQFQKEPKSGLSASNQLFSRAENVSRPSKGKNTVPPKQLSQINQLHQPSSEYQSQIESKAFQKQKKEKYPHNSMGGPYHNVKDNSQFWRSSEELQDRVKKAIQKSLETMKKFNVIKNNIQN